MVFESIVAELLNKTLGEYVKNLDHTQLKLSLWGGEFNWNLLKTSKDCIIIFI